MSERAAERSGPQNIGPLRTKLESAVWLRLCPPDPTPSEAVSGERAVEHLVQQGRLHPVRIGRGGYFISDDELHDFVRRETAVVT